MEKINISNYYNEKNEVRVECNDGNYKDMYESINEVFNFNTLKSFIDLGCATGHLIKNIKKNHNIEVKGIEYFEYHKNSEHCSPIIKDFIEISDLRDDLYNNIKYDIVYSTEVAEHIDLMYADNYMRNVVNFANDIIIMSWSAGIVHSQHFNPLEYDEYINYVSKFGLVPNKELTNKLLKAMDKRKHIFPWYRASITVFNLNKSNQNTNEIIERNIITKYNLISYLKNETILVNNKMTKVLSLYLKHAIFDAIFKHDFNKFNIKLSLDFKHKNESYLIYLNNIQYEVRRNDNYELNIILDKNIHYKLDKPSNYYDNAIPLHLRPDIQPQKFIILIGNDELLDYKLHITDAHICKTFHI
jgi:hypothetical protein